jgi:hypothetical protein
MGDRIQAGAHGKDPRSAALRAAFLAGKYGERADRPVPVRTLTAEAAEVAEKNRKVLIFSLRSFAPLR